MSRSTFKKREREVGLAVEHVAKKSCTDTVGKKGKLQLKMEQCQMIKD